MSEEMMEPKQGNKGLIIGGILLVLLLVGAAFIGGSLLNQANAADSEQALPDLPPGVTFNVEEAASVSSGEDEVVQYISITPAPGLPAQEPDASGLYVSREDDTITIGTGNVTAFVTEGEAPTFNYEGIAVDVLVTNQTMLYEDTTEFTLGQAMQQTVRPLDDLSELSEGTTLQVWGRQEGDRIIAETIVVMNSLVSSQR